MGLFSWLRRGRGDTEPEGTSSATSPSSATPKPDDEWELVPAFVPVPEDERAIPSVIATAIAAGSNVSGQIASVIAGGLVLSLVQGFLGM